MAKTIKKKFFEIDIPLIGTKFEALANSVEDLNNKTIFSNDEPIRFEY